MILIIFIFAMAGLAIAFSTVYAAIMLVRADRQLKSSQTIREEHKQQTLIEINHTCKLLRNADNDNARKEAEKELRAIRSFIEKYY